MDSTTHQKRFLAAFAASASIINAARWAKINRTCHYAWLREDPTYPERYEAARKEAARTLEDEAVRRAHKGIRKAIRYKGKIVAYDVEYSDSLMLELLRAHNPERFRPPQRMEHGGIVGADGAQRPIEVTFVDTRDEKS